MANNDNLQVSLPVIDQDGRIHDPACKGVPCHCFENGFVRVQTVSKEAFTRVFEQTGMSEKLRKE